MLLVNFSSCFNLISNLFSSTGLSCILAALCGITTGSALAQTTMTGRVIDQDGHPMSGVAVGIKDTKHFAIADADGRFSLIAQPGSVIEFSHVGFVSRQIVLGNEIELNVSLESSTTVLNELVVVGYGSQVKKDLTGSVASVTEKDFNKGNFTSPDQLIQGRVAGVQITNNSGQPGVATTIKIRGNSVLTGTGQPLFVVDGVPLSGSSARPNTEYADSPAGNPLNFLNPSDIASIDVLKDASAAAIYGSRAAYGVIIITTKKGQVGEPKIDLAMSTGLASIQKKIEVLDFAQYRKAIKYYGVNSFNDKGGNSDGLGSILREARQQNYTIGISGGNTSGKYRSSFGYYDQEGILAKSEIIKYNGSFSANLKFLESKKLGLDINLIASQYIEDIPFMRNGFSNVGTALIWNPTDSLRKADGSLNIKPDTFNPLAWSELTNDNAKVTTILASLSPHYEFADWLEFKMLASINYGSGARRTSFNQELDPINPVGAANIFNNENITSQITNTLNFHKEVFHDMNVTAVAGFEYMRFTSKGLSIGVTGPANGFGNFGLDYTNYIQYSNPANRTASSFANPLTELQSYFGRTVINYKSKYLLTATYRVDGSTKFGKDNKYGYFPSFSAAWVASEEDFFKVHFIDFLKFRIGWGKTGNQEFPAGASTALYGLFNNGTIGQINNPNPNLKWQSDEQLNIGIDFAILKNRISGTLDYFQKTTTDLLYPNFPIQPAPANSAITWINLDGKIQNTGLEATLNTTLVDHKNFSWNFGLNATFIRNNVSGLLAPIQTGWATSGATVEIIQNGSPMNTFYTRKFLGFDNNGISKYEDEGYSLHNVGNPNPTALLGINSTIRFKRLSLTTNMYGAFGQSVYNNTMSNLLCVANILTGKNIPVSEFQPPVKESLANPVTSSSRYVERADYLKMGNATLTYNFDNIGKAFKQPKIYVTGQNLFTITKYTGFNPEVNVDSSNNGVPSLGIDNQAYPLARTFIIGFNFSL